MTRDETVRRLKAMESDLRARGVGRLFLYGSVARNDHGDTSDVDIFFDRAPGARIGLSLVAMREALVEALGVPVDFGAREGLHPLVRADVEAAAIQVF